LYEQKGSELYSYTISIFASRWRQIRKHDQPYTAPVQRSALRWPYNWAETCSWIYNLIQSNKIKSCVWLYYIYFILYFKLVTNFRWLCISSAITLKTKECFILSENMYVRVYFMVNFMVTPCINNIQYLNFQLIHTTLKTYVSWILVRSC